MFSSEEKTKDKDVLDFIGRHYSTSYKLYPVDKATLDPMGKIYPFSKDAICTLPKSGGNDRLRPSVQIKNKK